MLSTATLFYIISEWLVSMGTRGAYGFRIDEKDKVTYNHEDSYPSVLGRSILRYISKTPLSKIKESAQRITMVNEERDKPSEELIKRYSKYYWWSPAAGFPEDGWYAALYEAQGDISVYSKGVEHMIDGSDFLSSSLFCEWAYIINADSGKLEIYLGFNKDKGALGRYARLRHIESDKGNPYYGVRLLKEMPLSELHGMQEKQILDIVEVLEA